VSDDKQLEPRARLIEENRRLSYELKRTKAVLDKALMPIDIAFGVEDLTARGKAATDILGRILVMIRAWAEDTTKEDHASYADWAEGKEQS
jgi:hypothetical protein